jgi:hypothetical protein
MISGRSEVAKATLAFSPLGSRLVTHQGLSPKAALLGIVTATARTITRTHNYQKPQLFNPLLPPILPLFSLFPLHISSPPSLPILLLLLLYHIKHHYHTPKQHHHALTSHTFTTSNLHHPPEPCSRSSLTLLPSLLLSTHHHCLFCYRKCLQDTPTTQAGKGPPRPKVSQLVGNARGGALPPQGQ